MKTQIFKIVIILGLFLSSAITFAQPGGTAQIEAVKVEFLTRRLNLSPEEAQRFWPVYNSYQKELRAAMLEKKKAKQEQKRGNEVDELEIESDILEIRKKYRKEFSEVLPQQKVNLFYQAERDFREQLIKTLGERHKHGS